jgi:putative drug exporter of the RND superfamily
MIKLVTRLVCGRPKSVLVAAGVAFLVAAALGGPTVGTLTSSSQDFQDPASQYERANSLIRRATGEAPYFGVAAVLDSERDFRTDRGARRAIRHVGALFEHQRGFQQLLDYASNGIPELVSRNGRQAVVLAAFARPADSTAAVAAVRTELKRPQNPAGRAGVKVRFGGPDVTFDEINRQTISGLEHAELLAFPLVLLLSFWVFRGLLTALLPPLVGGLAILLTLLVLRGIDQLTPISIFSVNLVTGMGLGLGLDYSLFMLSRYREELAGGAVPSMAVARALQTAGRTVAYSSLTVALALTSLLVFPIRFLSSMGTGGAIVALCDGVVALIVLPALLLVIGSRIDWLSPAWLQQHAAQSAQASETSGWGRLVRGVMRHPGVFVLLTSTVLLVAATPAVNLRLTSPGANLLPRTAESRQVETALSNNFAGNGAEAIGIVDKAPFASVRRLAREASAAAGSHATELAFLGVSVFSLGHGTWEIVLLPHGSPFSSTQQQLVRTLRALGRPYGALVGGWTAYFVDQKASIDAHVPLALLILFVLTAASLFFMTGSVVLPLKAFGVNLLTIATGAGLLVWIFQDGHLSAPLGFSPIGGLEEASLVLMFVVVFALSTDYEVFVIGRIKEARDSGLDHRAAVALGLERTGRLITAAALLFCVAIGALASTDVFFTKQFGLGTALTVALDASVVRALLVPGVMALLGEWAWWAPHSLRLLHKQLGGGRSETRASA